MLAEEEAYHSGRGYVETKHLLLALLRQEQTTAANLLSMFGVSEQKIQSPLEKSIVEDNDGRLSMNIKRAIELAIIEHRRMNDSCVRQEHLLLGLMREGKGNAAKILEGSGMNQERVIAKLAFMRMNILRRFWFRTKQRLNQLFHK